MNAAEQATDLHLASKIASVVNLFKQHFPDARADLKPWSNDSETRSTLDPDSLDVGFHFPGWSPRIESRTMLVQMRFLGNDIGNDLGNDLSESQPPSEKPGSDPSDSDPSDSNRSGSDLSETSPEKSDTARFIGLDVVGLTYEGEQWRMSTIADWSIIGPKSPAADIAEKLKDFARQVFELFQTSTTA